MNCYNNKHCIPQLSKETNTNLDLRFTLPSVPREVFKNNGRTGPSSYKTNQNLPPRKPPERVRPLPLSFDLPTILRRRPSGSGSIPRPQPGSAPRCPAGRRNRTTREPGTRKETKLQ